LSQFNKCTVISACAVKAPEGRYNLTHSGAKRNCGADRRPSTLEASPGGSDASKPALAKAREFLTFRPVFAIDPF
jgi:hypothetical protein